MKFADKFCCSAHVAPPSRETLIPEGPPKATATNVDPSALMAAFIQSPFDSPLLAPLGPLDATHVAPASVEV